MSRQCAHRWVARFDAEGWDGLHDRSSRPHRCPTPDPGRGRGRGVLAAREEHRAGPDGSPPRPGRPGPHGDPDPAPAPACPAWPHCDPLTGAVIRASQTTAVRYERDRARRAGPHGRQEDRPDPRRRRLAGPWPRADATRPRSAARASTTSTPPSMTTPASPTPRSSPTRRAPPAPGSSPEPLAFFAAHGITVEEVITDNAWNYRAVRRLPRRRRPPSAHSSCSSARTAPGRTARSNASTAPCQTEWAYRQVFTSNDERSAALAPWLEHYNHRRRHTALGGQPPISRLSPT